MVNISKNVKPQKSLSYLHTFVYNLNKMRNKYIIEIVPWSLDSTKLQRINGQFILRGGVKMLDIQIDKQTEKMKTENPLLFTFSLSLELCFTFFRKKIYQRIYASYCKRST